MTCVLYSVVRRHPERKQDVMSGQQKMEVEKLLSEQNVEKLEAALTKSNMEQLRKQMERLFTFKNVFNMHDDHLTDLAEFIIDLSRAEDRNEWADMTEKYVRGRIARYQERKKRVISEVQWAKVTGRADKVEMLDLTYNEWVYEAGYEYSKYQMYLMLCDIIRKVQEYEKARNG